MDKQGFPSSRRGRVCASGWLCEHQNPVMGRGGGHNRGGPCRHGRRMARRVHWAWVSADRCDDGDGGGCPPLWVFGRNMGRGLKARAGPRARRLGVHLEGGVGPRNEACPFDREATSGLKTPRTSAPMGECRRNATTDGGAEARPFEVVANLLAPGPCARPSRWRLSTEGRSSAARPKGLIGVIVHALSGPPLARSNKIAPGTMGTNRARGPESRAPDCAQTRRPTAAGRLKADADPPGQAPSASDLLDEI